MKKIIIGSVVGGIILFFWQFLSWTILDIHRPMQQYTDKQTEILEYLSENLDEGFYMLPTFPEGASSLDAQKLTEESMGKPWAQIYYHKAMNANMGMNMARALIIDIVAVLLLCWILLKMGNASFNTIILTTIVIGLISYFVNNYTQAIWFEHKTIADLIDALVGYGLVGAWLGFWLRRP